MQIDGSGRPAASRNRARSEVQNVQGFLELRGRATRRQGRLGQLRRCDLSGGQAGRQLPQAREAMYNSNIRLYNVLMSSISVSEAREKLAEVIDAARAEAVVLERFGRPAAVLVSPERYEQLLEAFEEAEDVAAFDAAMAEEGDNIPWDQVKADLGWA